MSSTTFRTTPTVAPSLATNKRANQSVVEITKTLVSVLGLAGTEIKKRVAALINAPDRR